MGINRTGPISSLMYEKGIRIQKKNSVRKRWFITRKWIPKTNAFLDAGNELLEAFFFLRGGWKHGSTCLTREKKGRKKKNDITLSYTRSKWVLRMLLCYEDTYYHKFKSDNHPGRRLEKQEIHLGFWCRCSLFLLYDVITLPHTAH